MSKHILHTALVAAALCVGACGGEAEPATPPAAEATAEAEPMAAPAPEEPAAPSAEALPVAEDFEDEMTTAVTADNYRAELDAVVAELDAE